MGKGLGIRTGIAGAGRQDSGGSGVRGFAFEYADEGGSGDAKLEALSDKLVGLGFVRY